MKVVRLNTDELTALAHGLSRIKGLSSEGRQLLGATNEELAKRRDVAAVAAAVQRVRATRAPAVRPEW